MKPTFSAAFALAGFLLIAGTAFAADMPDSKAMPMTATDGDTVIVLASDTPIGPDMSETDAAVRYYCAMRGKLWNFVSKERPPEMKDNILRSWSVMTYRCITPETK